MVFKTIGNVGSVQVLTAIHGLLFTFLATRLLSPQMFGELRYVLLLLPFLMVATLPSFDILVLRECSARSKVNLQAVVRKRMQFGFFGALIYSIILFSSKDYMSKSIYQCLWLAILLLPFYEVTTTYRNYLIGKRLRHRALAIQLRNKIMSIALILICTYLYQHLAPSPESFFFIFLIATTLPNIVTNLSLRRREDKDQYRQLNLDTSLTREAIVTSLASSIWIISYSLDRLFVERQLGVEQLAYYSILIMIPLMIAQLVDSLIMVFYREIFLRNRKKLNYKQIFFLVIFSFTVITIYAQVVHLAYPFIFGEFYSYSLSLGALSGLLIISGSIELFYIQYLYKNRKPNIIMIYNCLAIICLFIIFYFLIEDPHIQIILIVTSLKQIMLPSIFIMFDKILGKCRSSINVINL
jgi:O-antigen/teichoic acid export membrane protein